MDSIRMGPSIRVEGFDAILKERKDEVKVSYKGGTEYLPNFTPMPYQVMVNFTEEEFKTIQRKASIIGKPVVEVIHDLALQGAS